MLFTSSRDAATPLPYVKDHLWPSSTWQTFFGAVVLYACCCWINGLCRREISIESLRWPIGTNFTIVIGPKWWSILSSWIYSISFSQDLSLWIFIGWSVSKRTTPFLPNVGSMNYSMIIHSLCISHEKQSCTLVHNHWPLMKIGPNADRSCPYIVYIQTFPGSPISDEDIHGVFHFVYCNTLALVPYDLISTHTTWALLGYMLTKPGHQWNLEKKLGDAAIMFFLGD